MVESFEALFGFGTLGAHPGPDILQLRTDEPLAAAFGLGCDLLTQRARLEIRGVVARVRVGFSLRDFDDPRGDGFEKITIVRDHHHRAGKAIEKILEPAC